MSMALVILYGATWYSCEGDVWIVDMTDDASMRVADFWHQIFAERLVGTGYGATTTPWYAAAAEGNVLAAIGGSWSDALIETVPGGEGKWAVAPMPRSEERRVGQEGR